MKKLGRILFWIWSNTIGRLQNVLAKHVPYDKFKHFWVGMGIAFVATLFARWMDWPAFWFGWGAAIAAGAYKEIKDLINPKKGKAEWLDFVYTIAGGLLTAVLMWLETNPF